MKPSAQAARKIHLLGPRTGGGFFRTLCQHNISPFMNATTEHGEVTCAICIWRAAKGGAT